MKPDVIELNTSSRYDNVLTLNIPLKKVFPEIDSIER